MMMLLDLNCVFAQKSSIVKPNPIEANHNNIQLHFSKMSQVETIPSPAKKAHRASQKGYNPAHSNLSPHVLQDFLNAPLEERLDSIPGIGPANMQLLQSDMDSHHLQIEGIHTTFQLIGKFLSFKGPGVSSVEQCDKMYYWLQAKGIQSARATIVQAVAERANVMIPSIYDASAYTKAEALIGKELFEESGVETAAVVQNIPLVEDSMA